MMINNKKAMSPIIATMLLVAFAVSIGVTFISFAQSYINSGPKGKECHDYTVEYLAADLSNIHCTSSNPFALRFLNGSQKDPECYTQKGHGTSKICDVKEDLNGKIWFPNEVNP